MKMCDFHSHILPAADHGSDSEKTSHTQLDIIAKAGVSAVVATPHFYAHRENVESFLLRREHTARLIMPYAKELGIDLYLGAEVLVCVGMEHMEGLEKLCIEGTNTLLLEMPFSYWNADLLATVYEISRMNFQVVIAHIDRYLAKNNIEDLFEIPRLLYQVNASSLCGFQGRRKLLSLIDDGEVCALGSDLHGVKGYRKFTKAVNIMGGKRAAELFEKTAELLP